MKTIKLNMSLDITKEEQTIKELDIRNEEERKMVEKRIRDRQFISEYKELAGHIISPKMVFTNDNFYDLYKKINDFEKKLQKILRII